MFNTSNYWMSDFSEIMLKLIAWPSLALLTAAHTVRSNGIRLSPNLHIQAFLAIKIVQFLAEKEQWVRGIQKLFDSPRNEFEDIAIGYVIHVHVSLNLLTLSQVWVL